MAPRSQYGSNVRFRPPMSTRGADTPSKDSRPQFLQMEPLWSPKSSFGVAVAVTLTNNGSVLAPPMLLLNFADASSVYE